MANPFDAPLAASGPYYGVVFLAVVGTYLNVVGFSWCNVDFVRENIIANQQGKGSGQCLFRKFD